MKNIKTVAAALAGGITAAALPQYADAAIVTVHGNGVDGSVVLANSNDTTDLGGLLDNAISYSVSGEIALLAAAGDFFHAVRSSVSTLGGAEGGGLWTFNFYGVEEGALFNSADNWVPGIFTIGGTEVWGWLHVQLGGPGNFSPTIISFTYDDEATDATPFAKPVGGFSVESSAIPGPLAGLAGLAMGAAGVIARRRKQQAA